MKRLLLLFIACSVVCLSPAQEKQSIEQAIDSLGGQIPIVEYKFKPTQLILPASLITVGVLGTAIDGMSNYHLFNHNDNDDLLRVDDYLQWGLFGLTFINDLIGKEKNKWVDQLFLLGLAEGLNALMVQSLKYAVDEQRPNTARYGFPSGHTANAFLGAHLNFKEFKDSSMLLALTGYPLATFVAFARVHSNRHWLADVVAGAGFGILSVELSYLIYFPIRNAIARNMNLKKGNSLVVVPAINSRGGGLTLSYSF